MFCDIHTHNTFPHVPSLIDVSERVDLRFDIPSGNFVSYGIHPRFPSDWERRLQVLESLAADGNIDAVGECGMDVFSDEDPQMQYRIFVSQLTTAQKYRLPVVVHCVRLYQEVIRALKSTGFLFPLILHGYNGNQQTTLQLKKYDNVFFSIAKPPAGKLATAIRCLSADKILIESDTAAGADYAGIVESVAGILNMNSSELESAVWDNFNRILL